MPQNSGEPNAVCSEIANLFQRFRREIVHFAGAIFGYCSEFFPCEVSVAEDAHERLVDD